MRCTLALVPLGLLVVNPMGAQTAALSKKTPAAIGRAAATITASDVQRRINIIADDSMMGRDTPSAGLEMTATYIADQFKRFGLQPGGENGTWFQRYPIERRQFDVEHSHIDFVAPGKELQVEFSRDAFWRPGRVPGEPVSAEVLLVGGTLDPTALPVRDVKGRIAMLVVDYSKPRPPTVNTVQQALAMSAAAVIVVTNRDSAQFGGLVGAQGRPAMAIGGRRAGGPAPVVEVHERALTELMRSLGVNLDAVRASTTMVARAIPSLTILLAPKDTVLESRSAPNSVGLLPGTDATLKNEYLVFSAHMDHIGLRPGQPDSIANGADDDGSGTVGVAELAEAFSQHGARPKRSVIFLTVSGEEKGLWGSRYFTEHPTVPIGAIVADINLDMIGRNWKDTIVAIGKEHSSLGAILARVNAEHPELDMTAIDDRWPSERFYFRSDHYNFAKQGVPILFFFNGVHPDYHQVTDSPDKIDSEKESRILKLLFYLGEEIANAPTRPQWNPQSYKEIVEGATAR
jgi:hypothetical protein